MYVHRWFKNQKRDENDNTPIGQDGNNENF